MFRGRFENGVDEKGRLSIPAKFREILTTQFGANPESPSLIVTNYDACLWAYPVSIWQALETKVASLPQFLPEVKALQRVFISAACECALDKQGRILLPPSLKEYAQIEQQAVIVGMTQRIEIWSKLRWDKAFQESQEALLEMQDKLAELGL